MTVDSCVANELGWTVGLRQRAARARIPLSATLELTRRCNLNCVHCYLGDKTGRNARKERGTEEVKASLDEWVEAGCLYLLITGGDPMMRKDFPAIYRHACEIGLVTTVFCDGVLVTEAIAELFAEFPPRRVEVSIYGASAPVYESVTRVPGSYARAWRGIHRLLAAGVRVQLKTMLLTLNEHELETMMDQAKALNCEFRYDAAVFPCLADRNADPLKLRVSPEKAIERDVADPERREQWVQSIERMKQVPQSDTLYNCAAGQTMFHADPFGNFSPCIMTSFDLYSGKGRKFIDVWKRSLSRIRDKKRTKTVESFTGDLRGACSHCPAFNYAETGDEETESEHMKAVTRLRYQKVLAKHNRERVKHE